MQAKYASKRAARGLPSFVCAIEGAIRMAFRRNRLLPSDYMLSGTLAENPGSALLYGEPGCGKSTLALKFACRHREFDAVVFQLCGQRSVAEIAAELARKLKLGFETRPHRSILLPSRHGLPSAGSVGVGRHLGKRGGSAGARSSGLDSLHVAPAYASVDLAGSFDAAQETESALHGAGQSAARSDGCMLIS